MSARKVEGPGPGDIQPVIPKKAGKAKASGERSIQSGSSAIPPPIAREVDKYPLSPKAKRLLADLASRTRPARPGEIASA